MIVVDASVLCLALTDDGRLGHLAREGLGRDLAWAAPEHLQVETFSAIRGRLLGRKMSEQRAFEAVRELRHLAIERVDTAALMPRMWSLRDNVSGYDAAYVAAAEALHCPLVTADQKLARHADCEIQLVA